MNTANRKEKVSITISSRDYEQLERISMAGMRTRRNPRLQNSLLTSSSAPSVVPPQDARVVKMYSDLTFRDDTTNKFRRVTLVYPGEEDITFGRISNLTPVSTGADRRVRRASHRIACRCWRITPSDRNEDLRPSKAGSVVDRDIDMYFDETRR